MTRAGHRLAVAVVAAVLTGCGSLPLVSPIALYSEQAIQRPYTESNRVLLPAPEGISGYSQATAEAWNRTFNECVQVREWMSHEIAQRRARAGSLRRVFTILAAGASAASVAYVGIEESPKDSILILLGLASGTSAVTLQRATTRDDRLEELFRHRGELDTAQHRAIDALHVVERAVVAADTTSARDMGELEQLIGALQQRLGDWQMLCQ